MAVFVTSDQHIRHLNIIKYASRPFEFSKEGIQKCQDLIINNHNSMINKDDIVMHLGDLGFGKSLKESHITDFISQLNGRKVLFRGNHDKFSDEFYLSLFEEILEFKHINNTIFTHYQCLERQYTSKNELKIIKYIKKHNIKYIIHGHIHNRDPNKNTTDMIHRTNVSVDFTPNNFFPLKISSIL